MLMKIFLIRSILRHLVRLAAGCALGWSALAYGQTLQVTPGATNYTLQSSTVSYDVTITYPSAPGALGLRVVTPVGWTYTSTSGANPPTCLDAVGVKQNPAVSGEGFGWFYFTAPTSPASFRVTFTYPANQTGNQTVVFQALYLPATGAAIAVDPSIPVPDLLPPPTAPAITTPPANATVFTGTSTTFTVVATGTAPLTYQWNKAGKPIAGATNASYTIASPTTTDAGSYTVTVTNAKGSITSSAATLVVSGSPVIGTQPVDTTAVPGASATLTVKASSVAPLSYQWFRNGSPIAGATQASYTLSNVNGSTTGYYHVQVTNAADPVGVTSNAVLVQVVPTGASASHQLVTVPQRGYTAGGTIVVTNKLTFPTAATALGWSVLLPTGFSLASDTSGASAMPSAGATTQLDWAWDPTAAKSPITFTYTLNIAASVAGSPTIDAIASVRLNNDTLPITATPAPLTMVPAGSPHNADTNGDWAISVVELTQVITLFNTVNGTVRTGAYQYDTTSAGFLPDATRAPGVIVVDPLHIHGADTNADGMIDLVELMQFIELYNYHSGTTRTGEYHWAASETGSGADHYAPGP
jgi:hypothetical protein